MHGMIHRLMTIWHKFWAGGDEAYETLHGMGYRGPKGHVEEKCGQFVWKEDKPEIMLDQIAKKERKNRV